MSEIAEIEECRRAFENRAIPRLNLKLNESGEYYYEVTHMSFRDFVDGWKAREQQTAVAIQGAVEALERAMIGQHVYNIVDHVSKALAQLKALMAGGGA